MRASENAYLLRSLVALAIAPELPCSARCFPRALPCEQPLEAQFSRAGHVLGAASVHLDTEGASVLFSGDFGRPCDPLMRAPSPPPAADYLIVESTYGDREHPIEDTRAADDQVLAGSSLGPEHHATSVSCAALTPMGPLVSRS